MICILHNKYQYKVITYFNKSLTNVIISRFLNDMRMYIKQCIDDQCASVSDHAPMLEHTFVIEILEYILDS